MNNENLFNPRTIKRLVEKQPKLTAKQKKAANTWLCLLDDGSLENEKNAYFVFANTILRDILGYDVDDIHTLKHEEGNMEFPFRDEKQKYFVCFEAKGAKVKNLRASQHRTKEDRETPVKQLWSYILDNEIPYGIVTNYDKFILFDRSKSRNKSYEFDFSEIRKNEEKLKEFIAMFSCKNIKNGFIEKLEKESKVEEKLFTKEFYKLFHETRLMLINEFESNGSTKEDSIHFAQIFLNRLMFAFFAEDTDKIGRRAFERRVLKMLSNEYAINRNSKQICETIKLFFVDLDKGAETPDKIYGFNGGLFKEEIPNDIFFMDLREDSFFKKDFKNSNLKNKSEIDNLLSEIPLSYRNKINPIIKNLILMASFDFSTEVNVNILGHIFEQSLNDLETLQEWETSKRKKDGIFYTPEYITDYICRNTIIPYLSKNKKAKTPRKLVLEHSDKIEELETKFKEIKILDPACGSGAFLIKAVDILMEVHKEIRYFKENKGLYTALKKGRKRKLHEGQLSLSKWNEIAEAKEIIKNNIFGVDINEESVEITKLSLFLKIAQKDRKLISLSNNIKCGNSLIDDPEVDPKAFNWEKEFPDIMSKGGFDVVVGNPPYLRVQGLNTNYQKDMIHYEKSYKSATKRYDFYVLFMERGFNLLNEKGKMSFILPHKFMVSDFGVGIRYYLSENKAVERLIHFGSEMVFADASTYTCIIILSHNNRRIEYCQIKPKEISLTRTFDKISYDELNSEKWNISNEKIKSIFRKIGKQSSTIKEIFNDISQGIVTVGDDIFLIRGRISGIYFSGFSDRLKRNITIESELMKPILKGDNIKKYAYLMPDYFVFYPYKEERGKTIPLEEDILKTKYPLAYNYISLFKEELERKKIRYKTNPKYWYSLHRSREISLFEQPKLIMRNFSFGSEVSFDDESIFFGTNCYGLTMKKFDENTIKFYLAIINSNLMWFFMKNTSPVLRGGFVQYKTTYVENFPLPDTKDINNQFPLIQKADKMLSLNKDFYEKKDSFLKVIQSDFGIEKNSRKLESFFELSYDDFKKEIEKLSKKEIRREESMELMKFFQKYKDEIIALKSEIDRTDRKIDEMVYKLYGITNEERKIIEESSGK